MAEYPSQLERRRGLADGRGVLIRPIRADDEPREHEFLHGLSGETQRRRFIRYAMPRSDALVHFLTHIDYDRHMAFVCEATIDGVPHIVGEARYVANADGRSCEFGIVVADDWHHTGVAQLLMSELMREARRRGFETMEGLVLRDNLDMIGFVSALGFSISEAAQDTDLLRVVKRL